MNQKLLNLEIGLLKSHWNILTNSKEPNMTIDEANNFRNRLVDIIDLQLFRNNLSDELREAFDIQYAKETIIDKLKRPEFIIFLQTREFNIEK